MSPQGQHTEDDPAVLKGVRLHLDDSRTRRFIHVVGGHAQSDVFGSQVDGMVVIIDQDHQLQPHLRDRSPGHACGNCLE